MRSESRACFHRECLRGKPKIRSAADEDVYYKKVGISQSLSGLPLRDPTNYRLYRYSVLFLSRLPASVSRRLPWLPRQNRKSNTTQTTGHSHPIITIMLSVPYTLSLWSLSNGYTLPYILVLFLPLGAKLRETFNSYTASYAPTRTTS